MGVASRAAGPALLRLPRAPVPAVGQSRAGAAQRRSGRGAPTTGRVEADLFFPEKGGSQPPRVEPEGRLVWPAPLTHGEPAGARRPETR